MALGNDDAPGSRRLRSLGWLARFGGRRARAPGRAGRSNRNDCRSGNVEWIDVAGRKINITHGPVAALNWPAGMTMDFAVAQGVVLAALKPDAKIKFALGPKLINGIPELTKE